MSRKKEKQGRHGLKKGPPPVRDDLASTAINIEATTAVNTEATAAINIEATAAINLEAICVRNTEAIADRNPDATAARDPEAAAVNNRDSAAAAGPPGVPAGGRPDARPLKIVMRELAQSVAKDAGRRICPELRKVLDATCRTVLAGGTDGEGEAVPPPSEELLEILESAKFDEYALIEYLSEVSDDIMYLARGEFQMCLLGFVADWRNDPSRERLPSEAAGETEDEDRYEYDDDYDYDDEDEDFDDDEY
ncbi:MAG: hypothetical protein LBP95_01255 [Deltaproteobacteria bacterium]|jgi:hypothetical protein|nr:hypothetical protein [Deltaproteobacteria bacterium]